MPLAGTAPALALAGGARRGERCVTVILNPVSGKGDPEERKRRIEEALARHGYRCRYLITTPEQGARYWVAQALRNGADLLAVSGGDGTVIEAMAALVGTSLPLAIFPAGTGNLFAVNLGLPKDVSQAVHAALFGERRKLDLARIQPIDPPGEARYFVIAAGAGYDARVIQDADRRVKSRLGIVAYLWAALKNIPHRPVIVRLRLDDASTPLRRRAKSVMVANMGRLPGNLAMVPDAWPDDGMLDVGILKAESLTSWVRLIVNTLRRRLKEDPGVEYHRARRVVVRLSHPQPMQYDGEAAAGETRAFAVEIMPSAVEVMVPKSSPV